MGWSRHVYDPRSEATKLGWLTRRENAKRMALADKIVMAVVDRIAADIIRPGPKPDGQRKSTGDVS